MTRRVLLRGAAATGGAAVLPGSAEAFWPALLTGIQALVVLWNGFKMAEEVYQRFFSERKEPITREVYRFYGSTNFTIQNYYQFGNPYAAPGLGRAEPGCVASYLSQRNSTSLCCGAESGPVLLPTGCIIALNSAANELRGTYRDDNVFAYTRPLRYVAPVEPWQPIDSYGTQLKSDMKFYSPSGSVALRWLIIDRSARICRGEYLIRDDTSRRIVAEGQTAEFSY
jgi:hypothetical protein